VKAMKERKQKVVATKERFLFTQLIYSHCETHFKSIANRYKNQKEFFLRADEQLLIDLRKISRKFDSTLVAFNDYRSALGGLGKTGHNQELNPREIFDFKKDGHAAIDFYQDELTLWDYKRWALSNLDIIEREVVPMMANLEKIDAELNGLKEKLKRDSISVNSELNSLAEKINKTGLLKFDPTPLPNGVFNLKAQELKFGSELSQTRGLRDSSSLLLKQVLYKNQIKILAGMDSLAGLLMKLDLDNELDNYQTSLKKSYGSADNLKAFVKTTSDFAVAEKADKEKRISRIQEALKWIMDKSDSIPCMTGITSKKYFPMSIIPENHTYGLTFTDSAFAYFYTITPSRQVKIKSRVKLDSAVFSQVNLPITKGMSAVDEAGQTYYVIMYSEEMKLDKFPVFIYKVASTGLVWSNYYSMEGKPKEATFGKLNGELTIKLSTNSGNKIVVVQPDGKL
jgi:hypothetical protein